MLVFSAEAETDTPTPMDSELLSAAVKLTLPPASTLALPSAARVVPSRFTSLPLLILRLPPELRLPATAVEDLALL